VYWRCASRAVQAARLEVKKCVNAVLDLADQDEHERKQVAEKPKKKIYIFF
jgi:hypothetical protein